MKFRTEVHIPPANTKISLHTQILSLGSCFADVMGARLQHNKFRVMVNPFGVIYNPVSILKLLEAAIAKKNLPEELLWQHQDLWYHYDLHSEIVASTADELREKTKHLLAEVARFIAAADVLLLTLGTAFVYRLKETNTVVANCHKAPASLFSKELLTVTETTQAVCALYNLLKTIRPDIHIILTISPVRHVKDGIPENQVSKSVLRVACHEAGLQCPQLTYFPAYECMLDDLRDYRFYKKDMLHPTEVAEEYIWEKFVDAYMEQGTKEFLKDWESVTKAMAHTPFHPQSVAHQAFLRKTREKLIQLRTYVNVDAELELITNQIKSSH
ncbi:GSCFA domain-containing protein [Rhodocytophaga aerolata]|uniref:GSCFA domain-containing protein n=1 Tax=Rhodocytophaga aerolata TaxID=455078 RepID=A0ABT8R041_9BACT|nr:GSCFA domain-containing protein [Rhodocytophaga aerolata]MDO1445031.1 GSCFA domain-containing protein [Rhodocytophaga aerolata]